MPLLWKTSRIGPFSITHWANVDADNLLTAINRPPLKSVKADPLVAVYNLGKKQLAVREFPRSRYYRDKFDALARTVEKQTAVVEMPVALVEMGHGLQIVSLWKKGTTSLRVFLRKQPNRVLKQRACLSAMRRAAQLHAAGFAHGHLKPQNFVVDKNGNALLVDYTLMREDWSEVGKSGIALAEQLSALLGEPEHRREFSKKLRQEYFKHLGMHATRLERRKVA